MIVMSNKIFKNDKNMPNYINYQFILKIYIPFKKIAV